MSKFAVWEPRKKENRKPGASGGIEVRVSVESDIPVLAAIARAREGGDLKRWEEAFGRFHDQTRTGEALLLVAVRDGTPIGYGRAARFTPSATAPANAAPEGWYLTGVIVRPEFRERGAASALTRARLDWIARRASSAYYFANAQNRVSIELHRRLGFEEVTRDFTYPEVTFEGGEGILFRCDLRNSENRKPDTLHL